MSQKQAAQPRSLPELTQVALCECGELHCVATHGAAEYFAELRRATNARREAILSMGEFQ